MIVKMTITTTRSTTIFLLLLIAAVTVGLGWTAYQAVPILDPPLSKYFPSGALLYLQAKDFSSLLADWNGSSQKQQWLGSSNYQVFSRSGFFSGYEMQATNSPQLPASRRT